MDTVISGPIVEAKRIGTGSAGMDDVLGGGLPSGYLYLLEGDPGAGKTTLALQFLLEGVRNGERVLYVTLSESRDELLGVAKSHGFVLDSLPIFEVIPEEKALSPEMQYTVFHPSEVELADTTKTVQREVERVKPHRVVIDSLSELRMLAKDSLRYRREILGLKQFFAPRTCTVLMLDDRTGPEHKDLQLHSITHGVITLEKLTREYGVSRRRLEVVKLRGAKFREGFHDYSIRTGGVVVYPRLVASEHHPPFAPSILKSGVAELDELIGGGIDRGTSTLLIGPAGCGKSTIAAQFAASAAASGDRAAIYTFEEGPTTLVRRAESLNMDLRPHIQTGRVVIEQIDPAEMSPGEFVQKVREGVTRDNNRLVVIDSLNGFMQSMPGESFLTIQMHELLAFLNQHGVVTLMVLAQSATVGNAPNPVDVSYLADTILLLRYFEASGAVKQAISILKKRSGNHEHTIRELSLADGVRVGKPFRQFQGVLTGVPVFLGGAEQQLARVGE